MRVLTQRQSRALGSPLIEVSQQPFSAAEAPPAHRKWYVGRQAHGVPTRPPGAVTSRPPAAPGGSEVPAACCRAQLRSVGGWLIAAATLDLGGKAGARNRPRACRAPGDLLSGCPCCGVGRLPRGPEDGPAAEGSLRNSVGAYGQPTLPLSAWR